MDVATAATPNEKETAISPNHDADAKRQEFQKRKNSGTKENVTCETNEDKHSDPPTKAEGKGLTEKDDDSNDRQKKSLFTESEDESR